ncbi:glycoside hydrolase family 16 protein [Actinomadura sp. NPDC049753]|uniref:glycoside hydrolase family 16 protein n=1 Tax=Actinomadura sp. NPDC049753 TaxID=3154739 RepID=UPI003429F62F
MAMITGGVLAAGCSFALAAASEAGPDPAPARAVGSLERSAPAIAYGKPGPRAHEDTWDSAKKKPSATAARRYGWGRPIASDGFRAFDRRAWEVYTGPGNGGRGRRVAKAVSVRNGVLRITGKRNGDTGGVAWMKGAQKQGRWEARVKVSRGCACYNANLLLWPVGGGGGTDPQNGGGEIDWMETYGDKGLRNGTNFFLHYGPEKESQRLNSHLRIDLTKWHAFAVEWNSKGVTGYVDGRKWFHTSKREALPPGKMGQAIQLDWFPQMTKLTTKGVSRTADVTLSVDWIAMYRP